MNNLFNFNENNQNNQNNDDDNRYYKDDDYIDEDEDEDDENEDDEDEDDENEDDEDEDDEDEDDKDENVRINFTLPKKMKINWKNKAKDMSVSISQLIRNAVQNYNQAVAKGFDGDLKSMEKHFDKMGDDLDEVGDKIGPIIEKKVSEMLKPLGIFSEDEEVKDNAKQDQDFDSSEIKQRMNSTKKERPQTQQPEDPFELLKKLKELLDAGIITPEEFEEKKKKLLDKI